MVRRTEEVGVSSRRTLILLAAVVLGVVAAFALFTYVGGIEDRANDRAERVEVFKIAQDIPKGTFGDEAFRQGLIVESQIPKEFRPANAITDPAQIEGLVAVSGLASNQVVVAEQFVSQAETLSTYSQLLRDDEVAITVSINPVRSVGGLVVPGDFVNILVNTSAPGVTLEEGEDGETQPVGADGQVYDQPARFLYQKVQIIDIDGNRKLEPGETVAAEETEDPNAGSRLVTFAVPADAAQRIASALNEDIYLALVPPDYQPEPLPPIDVNENLPGETGQQLTPYGPDGRLSS
jgi:pilus assembly protein CpaB